MILQRFYDDKLAQASYLIGCSATHEALVIDPLRDVEPYLAAAQREGVRITDVTETHIHADFVSGARELAARTEARLHLSAEGGPAWQYAYAADDGAHLLHDGDRFDIGNVHVDVVHTPGHTPEHLTFVITDGAAADQAIGAVTGDFLFVGDVGRPDLLEKAAGMAGTMDAAARALFRSLARFRSRYPEWLQIWPGHGAGSACGKGLSSIPHSTLGYEQRFNWALSMKDEDEFVRTVLAGQPEPPKYFAEMKRINRDGPAVLDGFPRPRRLDAEVLPALLDDGATVVDIRPAAAFAAANVPGTISIPLGRTFSTWAGWLVPYDADFYLLADDEACPT
ncbi:MAG: MBL fold metallo-hydrolase, partial [Longimicrobiales bacterium]